jgi:hypothetical protein
MFHIPRHPFLCLQTIHLPSTPSTYKQAAEHPKWIKAMTNEYNALISNHAWTLCPRPLNQNVVKNKWVFKIKQKPDGRVDRFKARLVAKEFDKKNVELTIMRLLVQSSSQPPFGFYSHW